MMCTWKELLAVLPQWLAQAADRTGRENLQEIRLRIDAEPELRLAGESIWLGRKTQRQDLIFCVNAASRYSPWAAQSAAEGYLTAPGGHRIGLCGQAVVKDRVLTGVTDITSLCIRVARDFPGNAAGIPDAGSVLIIGPPGSGKTTLLRDLIRSRAEKKQVCVVDERGELFPFWGNHSCFQRGKRMDVLLGSPKRMGIDLVLRVMGPECIAVDEITAESDCDALLKAGWCGVDLLATAHAGSRADLEERPVYRPLIASGIFHTLVICSRDKSWQWERMNL